MMTPERSAAYNAMIRKINTLPPDELNRLINTDQCPFEPEHLIGVAIGMFHCECCGDMVIAGFPHPRRADPEDGPELDAK